MGQLCLWRWSIPKPRALALAAAAIALAGGVAWAAIRFLPSPQRELEAAYARLDAAMRAHDLPALMAQLAPDYHEQRTLNGKFLSRREAEDNYRKTMQEWNRIRNQKKDIYRSAIQPGKANILVERSLDADLTDSRGLYGPKRKTHAVTLITMEGDIWEKVAGRWLLKTRSVTSIEMHIDGKRLRAGTFDDDDHQH